jgi:hypothetical protein
MRHQDAHFLLYRVSIYLGTRSVYDFLQPSNMVKMTVSKPDLRTLKLQRIKARENHGSIPTRIHNHRFRITFCPYNSAILLQRGDRYSFYVNTHENPQNLSST